MKIENVGQKSTARPTGLKELTRGQRIGKAEIQAFIEKLEIPTDAKQRLLQLTPRGYTGYAERLARDI